MAKRIMGANGRPVRYESEAIQGKFGIRGRVELENGSMVIHDYPYLETLCKLFDEMIHEPIPCPDPDGRTPFSAYSGLCNKKFKNLLGVVIRCHVYRSVDKPDQQYPVRYVVKSITGSERLDAKATASDALVLLTSERLCFALDRASQLHQSYLNGEYGRTAIGEQCIILAIYNDYSYSAYFGKDPEASIMNFKKVHGMVPYVPRKTDATNYSSVAAYRSVPLPVKKSFVRSEDGFLVIR